MLPKAPVPILEQDENTDVIRKNTRRSRRITAQRTGWRCTTWTTPTAVLSVATVAFFARFPAFRASLAALACFRFNECFCHIRERKFPLSCGLS